jgi:GT2 family glycosyltransferase
MHETLAEAPVTVVVVNFNGGGHLRRCLAHVEAQTVSPERLIVVDNGSTDGSIKEARAWVATRQRLVARTVFDAVGTNIGFAAACNRAITHSSTEFVALLNPDAFPEPEWLAALITAAMEHPGCGAFGSRQMMAGKPGILDGIGDRWHLTGLSWREGHGRDAGTADFIPHEIFSACAAAALYRRLALLEIGGFDEDYYCFGEDVDLGYRLRLAGHGARYVPDAVVEHVGGASTPSEVAVFYGHRNTFWTLVKNTPAPLLTVALLGHLCQSILIGIVLGFRGQGRVFLSGKWAALCGLSRVLKKRRAVQAGRKVSTWAIWRMIDAGVTRRRRPSAS